MDKESPRSIQPWDQDILLLKVNYSTHESSGINKVDKCNWRESPEIDIYIHDWPSMKILKQFKK